MSDYEKIRRETMRWAILLTLNNSQPIGVYESIILTIVRSEYPDATQNEVLKHLNYLSERELIHADKQPDGRWYCKLARYGVDVVEYTVNCESGIARPEKYYNA
ncbi:MAG: hypothetical protein QX189_04415 [Methylococcales bacterium]